MICVLTLETVFPAYAGVILHKYKIYFLEVCFPRVCGGDPAGPGSLKKLVSFSPRMRGMILSACAPGGARF